MDNIHTLCDNIRGGIYDEEITRLKGEIINRHLLLMNKTPTPATEKSINDFRVGQTVKFNNRVRPQYMAGRLARVTKVNHTRVRVSLQDGAVGRFGGEAINCPIGIIDIVV